MSGPARLMFTFAAVGIAIAGIVFIASGLATQTQMRPTYTEPAGSDQAFTAGSAANSTGGLLATTYDQGSAFLVPVMIVGACLVVISVIFLFKRGR